MSHFHFDTLCGPNFTRDEEGLSFRGKHDALREAKRSLSELTQDQVPKIGNGTMVVWVRNEEEQVLFNASLSSQTFAASAPRSVLAT